MAPNKVPVLVVPAELWPSLLREWRTHNAKLWTAGWAPDPKLLRTVKPTKNSWAALVGSVLESETRVWEMMSRMKDALDKARSKATSSARETFFPFFPCLFVVLCPLNNLIITGTQIWMRTKTSLRRVGSYGASQWADWPPLRHRQRRYNSSARKLRH